MKFFWKSWFFLNEKLIRKKSEKIDVITKKENCVQIKNFTMHVGKISTNVIRKWIHISQIGTFLLIMKLLVLKMKLWKFQ